MNSGEKHQPEQPVEAGEQEAEQPEVRKYPDLPPALEKNLWPKGQSGNPGGRPKGSVSLTAILRRESLKAVASNPRFKRIAEKLGIPDPENLSVGELIVLATIVHAVRGQAKLIGDLWNRLDGKVPDRIAGHDGGPLQVDQQTTARIMSDPEAMRIARELAKRAGGVKTEQPGGMDDADGDDDGAGDAGGD